MELDFPIPLSMQVGDKHAVLCCAVLLPFVIIYFVCM